MRTLLLLSAFVLFTTTAASAQLTRTGPIRSAPSPSTGDAAELQWFYTPSYGNPVGISGNTGNRSLLGNHRNGLNGGVIYAMEMGERGDKPCYLKVWLTRQNAQHQESEVFDVCGGNGPTAGSKERIGAATPSQGTQVPALNSLRVCSNNRNGDNFRVKGLRLGRARVTETGSGTVTPLGGSPFEFSRTNCRDWEQQRTCPAGEVIVALDVHYNTSGGRGAISGIAPRCAAPDPQVPQGNGCRPGGC